MVCILRDDSRSPRKNRRPGAISRAQRKPTFLEDDQCAVRQLQRNTTQSTVKENRQCANSCHITGIPLSTRVRTREVKSRSAPGLQQARSAGDPVVHATQPVDVLPAPTRRRTQRSGPRLPWDLSRSAPGLQQVRSAGDPVVHATQPVDVLSAPATRRTQSRSTLGPQQVRPAEHQVLTPRNRLMSCLRRLPDERSGTSCTVHRRDHCNHHSSSLFPAGMLRVDSLLVLRRERLSPGTARVRFFVSEIPRKSGKGATAQGAGL
jgi:hypothetical protein